MSSESGSTSFSVREIEYLQSLPAVERVTKDRIWYTSEFRRECMRLYAQGESPVRIFRSAGLDPTLVGYKRIERCIARWKQDIADDDGGRSRDHGDYRVGRHAGRVGNYGDENHTGRGDGRRDGHSSGRSNDYIREHVVSGEACGGDAKGANVSHVQGGSENVPTPDSRASASGSADGVDGGVANRSDFDRDYVANSTGGIRDSVGYTDAGANLGVDNAIDDAEDKSAVNATILGAAADMPHTDNASRVTGDVGDVSGSSTGAGVDGFGGGLLESTSPVFNPSKRKRDSVRRPLPPRFNASQPIRFAGDAPRPFSDSPVLSVASPDRINHANDDIYGLIIMQQARRIDDLEHELEAVRSELNQLAKSRRV